MNQGGLDTKFIRLVMKLQDINGNHFILTKKEKAMVSEIGAKIKEQGLIKKCEDIDFAKQLMIKNNVPKKYWK